MGFFYRLVEGRADILFQHEDVAIAKVDGFPILMARLAVRKAEVEAAENGDDGLEVLGADRVGATVKVVGMVVLSFGIDDDDSAGLSHGTAARKREGHDVKMGVHLVVSVVDFDGVHSCEFGR